MERRCGKGRLRHRSGDTAWLVSHFILKDVPIAMAGLSRRVATVSGFASPDAEGGGGRVPPSVVVC